MLGWTQVGYKPGKCPLPAVLSLHPPPPKVIVTAMLEIRHRSFAYNGYLPNSLQEKIIPFPPSLWGSGLWPYGGRKQIRCQCANFYLYVEYIVWSENACIHNMLIINIFIKRCVYVCMLGLELRALYVWNIPYYTEFSFTISSPYCTRKIHVILD